MAQRFRMNGAAGACCFTISCTRRQNDTQSSTVLWPSGSERSEGRRTAPRSGNRPPPPSGLLPQARTPKNADRETVRRTLQEPLGENLCDSAYVTPAQADNLGNPLREQLTWR